MFRRHHNNPESSRMTGPEMHGMFPDFVLVVWLHLAIKLISEWKFYMSLDSNYLDIFNLPSGFDFQSASTKKLSKGRHQRKKKKPEKSDIVPTRGRQY